MEQFNKRRLMAAFSELNPREVDIYKMTAGIFEYDKKHVGPIVGEKYGISRNRVYQINKKMRRVLITKYGVDLLQVERK